MLLLVMLALIVLVPLTLRVVTPVTAPPKLALPVTTSALLPPATVLVKVTVLPTRVVAAPNVTAPVYACVLLVVTERSVMAPDPLMLRLLSATVAPTVELKVTAPLPCAIVRLCVPAVVPLTVLLKVTALLVVVRVVLAPKVTAPVYACVLLVVMLALIVLVPLTLRVVTPVTAPPKLALPVTVREFVPPASVLLKVTVLAVNVRPPDKVTAPV